ncbi:uncharacterized protein LTHEOB_11846 [Lasiodiplodia theobromae]|uniref:uncharacterized protein n=1 Tax=Lasiodiplodia theobromae TaxID=45133 RepID=UPI0015C3B353|nr:uncharacterized protein LTHEOB_11846 [Lasiodiplodia theobromae]KAF4536839.1 hypothetical protein LTHEOB_11846 [Lasiodiplodia theobromae]
MDIKYPEPHTALEQPDALRGALEKLKSNSNADPVFECYAFEDDRWRFPPGSRCHKECTLPLHEANYGLNLLRQATTPYTARQATTFIRLLLCSRHYEQTQFFLSLLISLTELDDQKEISKAHVNDIFLFQFSSSLALRHKAPMKRHDSLVPESSLRPSAAPAPAIELKVSTPQPSGLYANLEFPSARSEVLYHTELRCIGFITEYMRCPCIIAGSARTTAQQALTSYVEKPQIGILQPLLQNMLCPTHRGSGLLDVYREKWANHFTFVYNFEQRVPPLSQSDQQVDSSRFRFTYKPPSSPVTSKQPARRPRIIRNETSENNFGGASGAPKLEEDHDVASHTPQSLKVVPVAVPGPGSRGAFLTPLQTRWAEALASSLDDELDDRPKKATAAQLAKRK